MANLITVSEVKSLSQLSTNVADERLSPFIDVAERRYIKEQICGTYYDELVTENDTSSLTADNQIIYDKIKYSAAYFIIYEALPTMRNQATNTGVMNMSFDNGEQSEFRDYKSLRDWCKDQAEWHLKDAIAYIKDSRYNANYATFNACDSRDYDGNNTNTHHGIIF